MSDFFSQQLAQITGASSPLVDKGPLTVFTRNGFRLKQREGGYHYITPLIDTSGMVEGQTTPYGKIRNGKPEAFYLHPEIQPYVIENMYGLVPSTNEPGYYEYGFVLPFGEDLEVLEDIVDEIPDLPLRQRWRLVEELRKRQETVYDDIYARVNEAGMESGIRHYDPPDSKYFRIEHAGNGFYTPIVDVIEEKREQGERNNKPFFT